MLVRRARALLQHWSAQPLRSAALLCLGALLAFGGPFNCWLHCHIHTHAPGSGAHHHATSLAEWAQPSAEQRLGAASQTGVLYSMCRSQAAEPSALTIGILVLMLLSPVLRPRRQRLLPPVVWLFHLHRKPQFPPPRLALGVSTIR